MSTAQIYVMSLIPALWHGAINVATDSFGVLLVGEAYRYDPRQTRRSDVSRWEVQGEGYRGAIKAVVELDYKANGGIDLKLGGARWPECSLRPAGAIHFVARGEDESADELIAYTAFDRVVECSHGTFILSPTVFQFT